MSLHVCTRMYFSHLPIIKSTSIHPSIPSIYLLTYKRTMESNEIQYSYKLIHFMDVVIADGGPNGMGISVMELNSNDTITYNYNGWVGRHLQQFTSWHALSYIFNGPGVVVVHSLIQSLARSPGLHSQATRNPFMQIRDLDEIKSSIWRFKWRVRKWWDNKQHNTLFPSEQKINTLILSLDYNLQVL